MPSPDLNYLTSELSPYMQEVLSKAGQEVAADLIAKGMEALVKGAGRGARSIAISLRNRLRSSNQSKEALEFFTEAWAQAGDGPEREAAIRKLLETDPQFATSASALIQRRDYAVALRDCAAELPVAGLETSVSLPDFYVPLPLLAENSDGKRPEKVDAAHLALEGNHLVISEAGGGKSSLLRSLAFHEASQLLDDSTALAFDQLRLPVLMHARAMLSAADFSSALRLGAIEALGTFLRTPLPADFFAPGAAEGHRRWLVLIDGLDELDEKDRDRLLRVVASHATRGDAFHFVLTGRSEVLANSLPIEGFGRWSIAPLDEGERLSLIDRYLTDQKLRQTFASSIGAGPFAYITQRPLFLVMSATLFADTGELFGRKADLLEHFSVFLCGKVVGDVAERRDPLLQILRLVATKADTRRALLLRHRPLIEGLVGAMSTIALERELDRLLLRTGLIRKVGERYRFSHDVLRSYFAALKLSDRHQPGAETLKTLDPFTTGWETISLLGQIWSARGLDVELLVRSLLEFGEGGLRCATELIAATPAISDIPAVRIAEQLLREARETGPTFRAGELLPILARERKAVAFKLYNQLYSEEYTDRTFISECLLDAGLEDEAIEHLLWLADDAEGYSPDRVRAAELLLKHGHPEEALSALRDVASNGDEHWAVVDAAMQLYRLERTEANKMQLADLLASEPGPHESVFMSTFAELVALGELDLALPRLRAAASAELKEKGWGTRDDAIEAAVAIGKHHDRNEGKQLLEALLRDAKELRQEADVISAIAELGFDEQARTEIRQSLTRHPLAIEDYSLKLLSKLGLTDVAQATLEKVLEERLSDPRIRSHEIIRLVEQAPGDASRSRLANILRRHLPERRDPRLVTCLATLGATEEARERLKGYLEAPDISEQVDAAGELCALGEQTIGIRRLRRIVRRTDLSPTLRISAAYALKRAGLLRLAAFSFARIANDETLGIHRRTSAAISFDKLLHERNDLVWHSLMRVLTDKDRRVADRVEAGEALLTIDGDDGYDDIVFPEIEAILDEEISDAEALVVGGSLGLRGWRLQDMPKVRSVLTSSKVGLGFRIDTMRTLSLHDRAPEVRPLLRAIASAAETPAKYAIEAAGVLSRSARDRGTLTSLAADITLPPAWRLAAIRERRPHMPSRDLLRLARDESASIEHRVEALNELSTSAETLRNRALSRMARTLSLTFWEWLKIAEAAGQAGLQPLRKKALRAARADSPLSIGERLALAKEHQSSGNDSIVRALVKEMLALPISMWVHCDDGEEALTFCTQFEPTASILLIKALLRSEETSWHDIRAWLAILIERTSEAEALAVAEPLFLELSSSIREAGTEDFGWPEIAAGLIEAGWFDDYDTLLTLGANEERWLGERVHAYGLVIRHAPISSPAWRTAETALEKLGQEEAIPARDRSYAARRLRNLGLEQRAERLFETDAEGSPQEDPEPLARARRLNDLGRLDEAESLLRSAAPEALFSGFLFDQDRELLRSTLGDDFVESRMREKVLANDDPYDQLWRATEIVERTGDRDLLKLLHDRAADENADPDERLEAIGGLEQLGFRVLSRDLLAGLDLQGLDPARAANQLICAGRKADAVALLSATPHARCDDEHYLRKVMSDLGLQCELASPLQVEAVPA
ncbi:MAG: hypothetical protein E7812_02275 [Phenylobacterium sp.]|nr:MAG: hypothetical protein E7812_02275 [Phenylobacterium sp.]